MTNLSEFSPEEIESIVSLPYKAGINVSYSEDEEGEGDDESENRSLEKSLSHLAKAETASLNKQIAAEILQRRKDWSAWAEDVFHIEPACEAAVRNLKIYASEGEVKAYIKMILSIVTDVAQAHGEFDLPPEEPKGFMGVVKKMLGGKGEEGQPMNVSAAEDESINAITRALKKYA